MIPTENAHNACHVFRDQLDAWLDGEYLADHMQQHHDSCAACRHETQLARAIGGITGSLPQLTGPEIHTPKTLATNHGFVAQLTHIVHTWRQPFVFVPTLALVLAVIAWTQLRTPDTAVDPELVVIDGVEYTREDIRKAAADLQIALRYIDRYRPGRVISAELDTKAPARETDSNEQDDSADAPTI
ncbi:MAG: hypothetical protein SV422_16585 [Pseudomonadota bacterium]|nr:hypothetical protein [Pseudomonadota bacterium]